MSPMALEATTIANGTSGSRRRSSVDKNNTSTDSLEDLRALIKSPSMSADRDKLSIGGMGKNSVDGGGKNEKKDDSMDDLFPINLSPVASESSKGSKEKEPDVSAVLIQSQRTPCSVSSQKMRDSTGYYTANESIQSEDGQSISDESKEFIEFSNENTPTAVSHQRGRRSSLGSNSSDTDLFQTSGPKSLTKRSSNGSSNNVSSTKILQLESSLENATGEIEELKSEVNSVTKEKMILDVKLHSVEEQKNDLEVKMKAFYDEIQSQAFLNSVLEQKNDELQCQISSDRLNKNEQLQSKTRKLKDVIEKLTEEKKLYEDKANDMCKEMGEQMTLLQSTAMARIEALEAELLQERREKEDIEGKLRQLKQASLLKSFGNNGTSVGGGRKSDSSDDTDCTNSTEEKNDDDGEEEEQDEGTPTK